MNEGHRRGVGAGVPPRAPRKKKMSQPVILKSGMAAIPTGTKPRLSLYRAKIELDDSGTRMNLDLLKDDKKMYLVITDPETHIRKEMDLYLK